MYNNNKLAYLATNIAKILLCDNVLVTWFSNNGIFL